MDQARSYFSCHHWIEFETEAGSLRVLDITHARRISPGEFVIAAGKETRWQYLANAIEDGFLTKTWNHNIFVCKCGFVFLLRYFR
jgi:hypothetical protein